MVGLAQPVIAASLQGAEALFAKMELLEFELRTALFCTGQRTVADLQENRSTVVKVGSQTGKQAGNTTVDRADNNRSRSGI
jgi:isopentenyl diphosphate isomerase/L-lactate dehydrogenase-like FMN-dependent dehydrogenase